MGSSAVRSRASRWLVGGLRRTSLRRRLRALLWRTREEDGGWNDRVFPRSKAYATAMAVLAIRAPDLHLPGWSAGGG